MVRMGSHGFLLSLEKRKQGEDLPVTDLKRVLHGWQGVTALLFHGRMAPVK